MVWEEEGGGESNQKSWAELKVRLVCTFSLVPSPCASPGEKQFGERSQISWAYSPKVVRTNEIVRLDVALPL